MAGLAELLTVVMGMSPMIGQSCRPVAFFSPVNLDREQTLKSDYRSWGDLPHHFPLSQHTCIYIFFYVFCSHVIQVFTSSVSRSSAGRSHERNPPVRHRDSARSLAVSSESGTEWQNQPEVSPIRSYLRLHE